MTAPQPRPLVVGIGNPDRGDDAAGRLVAQALRTMRDDRVAIAEADGEATDLLDRLDGSGCVFLVDACASGGTPGSMSRFDAAAGPLPQTLGGLSTHGFGLAAALELARSLGRLPRHCIVYALEGADFTPGAAPSAAVAAAVPVLAARLRAELDTVLAEEGVPCTKPR